MVVNPHGHHIVLKGNTFPESAQARRILCKYGINPFIDCANLVISRNHCHSDRYVKKVLADLEYADKNGGDPAVIKALAALAKWH